MTHHDYMRPHNGRLDAKEPSPRIKERLPSPHTFLQQQQQHTATCTPTMFIVSPSAKHDHHRPSRPTTHQTAPPHHHKIQQPTLDGPRRQHLQKSATYTRRHVTSTSTKFNNPHSTTLTKTKKARPSRGTSTAPIARTWSTRAPSPDLRRRQPSSALRPRHHHATPAACSRPFC